MCPSLSYPRDAFLVGPILPPLAKTTRALNMVHFNEPSTALNLLLRSLLFPEAFLFNLMAVCPILCANRYAEMQELHARAAKTNLKDVYSTQVFSQVYSMPVLSLEQRWHFGTALSHKSLSCVSALRPQPPPAPPRQPEALRHPFPSDHKLKKGKEGGVGGGAWDQRPLFSTSARFLTLAVAGTP